MSFNAHYLSKKLFEEMNMWFCTFGNGLIEYDMSEVSPKEYNELMTFTTNFCYGVSDFSKADYFLRISSVITVDEKEN